MPEHSTSQTHSIITDATLEGADDAALLSITISSQDADAFFVDHANREAHDIGQDALQQLVRGCGMAEVNDSSEFIGKLIDLQAWGEVKELAAKQRWRLMRMEQQSVQREHAAHTSGRFVYVISANDVTDPLCKIGIANSPEKRLQQLSTSSPHALRLEFTRYSDNASAVEKAAHSHFQDDRRNGEWFAIHPSAAMDFIIQSTRNAA